MSDERPEPSGPGRPLNIDDDDFALFSLPRRMELDAALLQQRWKGLQSEVHPDRFATQGKSAQRVAMQWSVRVNEGYRRLKDPLARAAYLCELSGAPVEAHSNTAMPMAFLTEQMAWRESLDDAADMAAVQVIDDQVQARERQLLDTVTHLLDAEHDAPAAAEAVRALMFVTRFRDDVQRRLDALEP